MLFQTFNLVRHHLTFSALSLLLGIVLPMTALASNSRAIVRIPSLTTVEALPVLTSPHSIRYITYPPTPPSAVSSILSRIVRHARTTRSRVKDAGRAVSHTLCHARPPFVRSRLALPAYYTLSLARLELCRPQPSFIKSLPRSPWRTRRPRLHPVLPRLPPPATRVARVDIPPTNTWMSTMNGPAPPQPAYIRARRWSPSVDEVLESDAHLGGTGRNSDTPVWKIVGTARGLLVVIIASRMKGKMGRKCERELLSAAPPALSTFPPTPLPIPILVPTPVSAPVPLLFLRPSSPLQSTPDPLPVLPSPSSSPLPFRRCTPPPPPPPPPPVPSPLSYSPSLSLRFLLPTLPSFVPPPPPPPLPPPPPPETFSCSSPEAPPRRMRYHYRVNIQGYRSGSLEFFCQKICSFRLRGRPNDRARIENAAWEGIDRLVGELEGMYRLWEDAWYDTRVVREVETYELRRRPNGRYCWAKANHEAQVCESLEDFMKSVSDRGNAWDEEMHWAAPNSLTPSRPQSPLGPPVLEDPHPLMHRKLVVVEYEEEEETEGVDRGWEERVRQGELPV